MLDNNYVKVFSGSFLIAQLITDRLSSMGIIPVIKDESESARMAGFGSSFPGYQELYVSTEELKPALSIVKTVNAELEL